LAPVEEKHIMSTDDQTPDARLFVIRVTGKQGDQEDALLGFAIAERMSFVSATGGRLAPDDEKIRGFTLQGLEALFAQAGDHVLKALPISSESDPKGGGYVAFAATRGAATGP
jgi:hypothetical protein